LFKMQNINGAVSKDVHKGVGGGAIAPE